ncbi:hypothetical protein [Luteimonas sp. FCS-9]|uniref:hypothetical protein n=1 Tax=Luteimonas sp. FCS-9 TaxID=1547516 RepID=UPI0012E0A223|nr:hypothetical protein [Luteimonas sp. FCS-9]
MKAHFTRLVETDISAITPEFGPSLVEAYKDASQQIEKLEGRNLSAPQFCRYQGEAGLTSVLAECLSGNTDALSRLHSASSSIDRSVTVIALHGTFSVANILTDQFSNRARIIYDNGSFIGPVEYDLATLIETFVDLANKKRLTGQDSGAVDRFLSALVSAFESEFKMDRQVLRDITLYQYVGHINLFQTLCSHASRPLVPSATYAKLIATFIRTMDELI